MAIGGRIKVNACATASCTELRNSGDLNWFIVSSPPSHRLPRRLFIGTRIRPHRHFLFIFCFSQTKGQCSKRYRKAICIFLAHYQQLVILPHWGLGALLSLIKPCIHVARDPANNPNPALSFILNLSLWTVRIVRKVRQ